MKQAKVSRVAVSVFGPAREIADRGRHVFSRRLFFDAENERALTEEERRREKDREAKERREAAELADKRLAALALLEEQSRTHPAIFRGSEALPIGIREQLKIYGHSDQCFSVFRDRVYELEGPLTDEEFALLTYQEFEKEQRYFARISERKNSGDKAELKTARPKIPPAVQREVWNRDGGRCVLCGRISDLEFDHIIPVAKGGSSTPRNVQLLCETCNRQKGDRI